MRSFRPIAGVHGRHIEQNAGNAHRLDAFLRGIASEHQKTNIGMTLLRMGCQREATAQVSETYRLTSYSGEEDPQGGQIVLHA